MPSFPTATDGLAETLNERLIELVRPLLHGAAAGGLSRTSSSVLATLRDHGSCNITELAEHEHVAQPSMTTLVQRLEEHGWVERRQDEADRRRVRVTITDAGREVLARRQAERTALLAARLDALDPEDRDTLVAALPALARLAATPQPEQEIHP